VIEAGECFRILHNEKLPDTDLSPSTEPWGSATRELVLYI
jgi:hypothetical protein